MDAGRKLALGPALVLSMLLFALGTSFGVAVHAWFAPAHIESTGDDVAPTVTRAEWDRLVAAVARLEATTRGPELAAPDARTEVGALPVTPDALTELTRDVRELRSALERLRVLAERVSTGTNAPPTPREILDAVPEVDWKAVDALRALIETNEDEALRQLRLSTPAEIVRRFGAPTDVYRHGEGIGFAYSRDVDTQGEVPELRGVRFTFIDGCLQALWID
ncbi:MAG: hypothetical protein L6Q99_09920 [Planctomycetes bacterium]|nr:hypothetical protein [Planctomycetota bacterium]